MLELITNRIVEGTKSIISTYKDVNDKPYFKLNLNLKKAIPNQVRNGFLSLIV
jgi:hypothetical protein